MLDLWKLALLCSVAVPTTRPALALPCQRIDEPSSLRHSLLNPSRFQLGRNLLEANEDAGEDSYNEEDDGVDADDLGTDGYDADDIDTDDATDTGTTLDPGTGDVATTPPETGDVGTTDPGAGDVGTTAPGTEDLGTGDVATTPPEAGDVGTTDPGAGDVASPTDPGTESALPADPGPGDVPPTDPGTGNGGTPAPASPNTGDPSSPMPVNTAETTTSYTVTDDSGDDSPSVGVIIAAVAGAVLLPLICVTVVCCCCCKACKGKRGKRRQRKQSYPDVGSVDNTSHATDASPAYPAKTHTALEAQFYDPAPSYGVSTNPFPAPSNGAAFPSNPYSSPFAGGHTTSSSASGATGPPNGTSPLAYGSSALGGAKSSPYPPAYYPGAAVVSGPAPPPPRGGASTRNSDGDTLGATTVNSMTQVAMGRDISAPSEKASTEERKNWLDHQLDCIGGAPLLQRFELLGQAQRRYGGQAVVQFARSVRDRGEYAIKFFVAKNSFEAERAVYTHPVLGQLLPRLEGVFDNADGAVADPKGYPLPPCVVMERGESLDEWSARRKPDIWAAMPVLANITQRLERMHDAGYAHRDLKPGNIMWLPRENQWTLIDFGCAAQLGEASPVSFTLTYAPPEVVAAWQAGDKSIVAERSMDAWAMGVVIFEMLTGRPAFDAMSCGKDKVLRCAPS